MAKSRGGWLVAEGRVVSEDRQGAGFWVRVAQFAYRMRRRAATVLVILAALVFGYHAIFGANGVNVFQQRRAEDKYVQKRIIELQQENTRLAQQVQELKSDPDTIEHEARERLHYARPGEVIWTEDGKQVTSQAPAPKK
jgi:cell division protein FtsB